MSEVEPVSFGIDYHSLQGSVALKLLITCAKECFSSQLMQAMSKNSLQLPYAAFQSVTQITFNTESPDKMRLKNMNRNQILTELLEQMLLTKQADEDPCRQSIDKIQEFRLKINMHLLAAH